MSSGLVRFGPFLWVAAKARKPATCAISGTPIVKGDLVYRPLTNSIERSRRIHVEQMHRLARPA